MLILAPRCDDLCGKCATEPSGLHGKCAEAKSNEKDPMRTLRNRRYRFDFNFPDFATLAERAGRPVRFAASVDPAELRATLEANSWILNLSLYQIIQVLIVTLFERTPIL